MEALAQLGEQKLDANQSLNLNRVNRIQDFLIHKP